MKGFLFFALLMGLFATRLMAQDESPQLRWNGAFSTDDRVHAGSDTKLFFQEYRIDLKAEAKTDRTRFFADTWIRGLGYPEIGSLDDLFSSDAVNRSGLSLREAYF